MIRWPKRRKKPYSWEGIHRVPCVRCGAPSAHQWQICADGNNYRGLCEGCDLQLNELVLRWVGHPDREQLIAEYRKQAGL